MEGVPGRGEVIFLRFPHTDLTHAKHRPALVLAQLSQDDMIVCQITSRDKNDPNAVMLDANGFVRGGLPKISYARAGRLFTANTSVITRRVGAVREEFVSTVIERLLGVLRGESQP